MEWLSKSDCKSSEGPTEAIEWEMRPSGMLVQKRGENADAHVSKVLRVRVLYGEKRYEVSIEAQATFGELKKLLTVNTGLHPGEQKLIYRRKERDSAAFLDTCGVKDRSKLVLIEDPWSRERKHIETQKNAKMQRVHQAISNISFEVDKFAEQVTVIGKSISNGKKVAEVQITTLIELLMRLAIKLDSIPAEGDASLLKVIQAKRVQRCVERLDTLKISNEKVSLSPATPTWEFFD